MNRIKINPLAIATEVADSDDTFAGKTERQIAATYPPFVDELFEFGRREAASDDDYALFAPQRYTKTYSYPLIVWLHDDGDTCQQLQRIMPWLSLQNYVGVAPQAPIGDDQRGYYWEQSRESIDSACLSANHAVDQASRRLNVDLNRIFIGGAGAAGTMAFRIAFEHPELFRGVISINGGLPEGQTPFARLGQSRLVDVFWAQCRDSATFQTEDLCNQLRVLHAAGFSSTVRQYPCGDRNVEEQDDRFNPLGDLNRWIMSHFQTTIS